METESSKFSNKTKNIHYKTTTASNLHLEDDLDLDLPEINEKKQERKYFSTLYNFMNIEKMNPHINSSDLLKKSKDLLLTNKNYKKYTNYYNTLTSGYCFKLPRVACYPIQKNSKFISLKSVINKEEEKDFNKIPFSGVDNKFSKTAMNFRPKGDDLNGENRPMDADAFLRLIDDYCNTSGIKGRYFSHKENGMIVKCSRNGEFFKDFVFKKDNFQLFQNDETGKNIFSDDNTKRFILENSFPLTGKDLTVLMQFTPISLMIVKDKQRIIQEIFFPFEFYYYFVGLTNSDFKLILAYCLEFDENKKLFKINSEKICKAFEIVKNGEFELFADKAFINYFLKREERDITEIVRRKACKFLSKEIFNDKCYIELCLPDPEGDSGKYITFDMKINLPKFRFSLLNYAGIKSYYTEKELENYQIEFFLKENFKGWDTFLIYSFSIYKNFRWNINKVLSITEGKHLKVNYKEDKYLTTERTLEYYIERDFTSFDKRTKKNCPIFLMNDKKEFLFFEMICSKIDISYKTKTENIVAREDSSDDDGPILTTKGDDFILRAEKKINLIFTQAIQLNRMRRAFTVEDLVRKTLNINKTFDRDGLEIAIIDLKLNDLIFNFDESLLKYLEKKEGEEDNSEDHYSKSSIQIQYVPIKFKWQFLDDETKKIKRFSYQMSREEGREILDVDSNNWGQFIMESFDKYSKGAKVMDYSYEGRKNKKKIF